MNIYAISCLEADKNAFKHLSLKHDFIPISWVISKANESIEDYMLKLSTSINQVGKFAILGVHFFCSLIATEK